jgi:hypothetical protein
MTKKTGNTAKANGARNCRDVAAGWSGSAKPRLKSSQKQVATADSVSRRHAAPVGHASERINGRKLAFNTAEGAGWSENTASKQAKRPTTCAKLV